MAFTTRFCTQCSAEEAASLLKTALAHQGLFTDDTEVSLLLEVLAMAARELYPWVASEPFNAVGVFSETAGAALLTAFPYSNTVRMVRYIPSFAQGRESATADAPRCE